MSRKIWASSILVAIVSACNQNAAQPGYERVNQVCRSAGYAPDQPVFAECFRQNATSRSQADRNYSRAVSTVTGLMPAAITFWALSRKKD